MKRREFIAGVTGAGAGLAWAATTRAGTAEPPPKEKRSPGERIRVALIGARNMGGKTHLPTLLHEPTCHLAAMCDVDSRVLGQALTQARSTYREQEGVAGDGAVRGYCDFREVLGRDDIDAVVIATPDHWHVPLAKAAVRAGKAVYVEKPLSLYVTEGRDLADLAARHRAILQVGSQHRSMDRLFLAAAAVQSGLLGDVRHIDVAITTRPGSAAPWEPQPAPPELDYDLWLGPAPWSGYHPNRVHYDFRFVPDFSGGDITNWGGHYLDNVQQVLAMDASGPVSVEGRGARHPAGALHTPFFAIHVDYAYAQDVTVTLRSGESAGLTIRGSEASLFVSRDRLTIDPPALLHELPREAAQGMRKSRGSHLQNWLACVRSGRAGDLHAPVEIGHRSATLCHLANIAIELGRPLTWDPERERFNDDAHANALLDRPVRKGWEI